MKSFALACLFLVSAVSAADEIKTDYVDWKENQVFFRVRSNASAPVYFEGVVSDNADNCFKIVEEKEDDAADFAVSFHVPTLTCQLFKKKDLGDHEKDPKVMMWDLSKVVVDNNNLLFVKNNKIQEDDHITTGGIIATIILAIIFGICLVALAFICKETHEPGIADQLDRLAKKELDKGEAASEEWERKSIEAEEAAKQAA